MMKATLFMREQISSRTKIFVPSLNILEHLRAIMILFAFISLVVLSWQQKKQLEAKII